MAVALWDTSCRAYKDEMKKQQAWQKISAKFGASGMSSSSLTLSKVGFNLVHNTNSFQL